MLLLSETKETANAQEIEPGNQRAFGSRVKCVFNAMDKNTRNNNEVLYIKYLYTI